MYFLNKKRQIRLFLYLILSIILSFNLVKAYSTPGSVQIIQHELEYQVYTTNGAWYTKNTPGIVQRVYNRETFTTLTNPCTSCKIASRLKKSPSDFSTVVITTTGNTGVFTSITTTEGDWQLQQMRYDFSLLNTYHYGTWYINSEP